MNVRKQAILNEVIQILKEMIHDWELDYDGEINQDVRLVKDLGFVSIDIIQLVVAIEEGFQKRSLPFDKLLLKEGRYVDELYARDIVDFLEQNL